jgi:hypothetical protein
MTCYRLAATRITQPCASAVEDACHSQTFFVDEVLDVPAVNERVFFTGPGEVAGAAVVEC